MYKYIIFFCIGILGFPITFVAMEQNPSDEKTIAWEIFHLFNQKTDPLAYFTANDSPHICKEVLKFNPNHPDYQPFTSDAKCKRIIKSAFKREKALLVALEDAITKNSYEQVEQMRNAELTEGGYYSSNAHAVIAGFLKTKIRTAADEVQKLQKQVNPLILPKEEKVEQPLEKPLFPDEKDFPTLTTVQQVVLNSHPTVWSKFVNYLSKTTFEPISYITDSKARIECMAILHFDPEHPFHNTDALWNLNPDLPFHKELIHQAFERQYRLLTLIEYSVNKNYLQYITQLNPENSDNKQIMSYIRGYYSPITKAVIAGYLQKKVQEKSNDLKKRQNQNSDTNKTSISTNIPPDSEKTASDLIEEARKAMLASTPQPRTIIIASQTATQKKHIAPPIPPKPKKESYSSEITMEPLPSEVNSAATQEAF